MQLHETWLFLFSSVTLVCKIQINFWEISFYKKQFPFSSWSCVFICNYHTEYATAITFFSLQDMTWYQLVTSYLTRHNITLVMRTGYKSCFSQAPLQADEFDYFSCTLHCQFYGNCLLSLGSGDMDLIMPSKHLT